MYIQREEIKSKINRKVCSKFGLFKVTDKQKPDINKEGYEELYQLSQTSDT